MAQEACHSYWDEYLHIVRELGGDLSGRAVVGDFLASGYPGPQASSMRWATNPYILDERQYATLERATATMGSVMEKVMAKYHRDRAFRKLFALSPEVEALTLVPSGYRDAVPLARVDVLFDPYTCDYKILGVVTGGVDGMAMATSLTHAITNTDSYRAFAAKHPNLKTFDPARACVQAIVNTYAKWTNAGEGRSHPTHPSIAVVDVAGSPRRAETKEIVNIMREMGCYARATDFSQLRIEKAGGQTQLVDNHGAISCVWLRAKASEVVDGQAPGLDTLIKATRNGIVCTVGGYRSWPCCTNRFSTALRTRDCRALLSHDENEFVAKHVAELHAIEPDTDLSDFYDQENWLIRAQDGDARKGVIVGAAMSKMAWRTRLAKGIKRHDVLRRVIDLAPVTVACVDEGGYPIEKDAKVLLSLYTFGGKLAGIAAYGEDREVLGDPSKRMDMCCVALV